MYMLALIPVLLSQDKVKKGTEYVEYLWTNFFVDFYDRKNSWEKKFSGTMLQNCIDNHSQMITMWIWI